MYFLSYDNISKREIEDKELIDTIRALNIEYRNKIPHILVIRKSDKKMEAIIIGIGDRENRSTFMYDPEEIIDDTKVAYDPQFIKDETTMLSVFQYSNGEFQKAYKHRYIKFDDVIKEIEYYMENGKLSNNLKLYSW